MERRTRVRINRVSRFSVDEFVRRQGEELHIVPGDESVEQFRSLLAEYIRAESSFRQAMKDALNVQQRAFNATFRVLCVGQPPVLTPYIGSERVATNIMMAKYPLHLVKVGGAWKWDFFGGFSREVRNQRMAVLRSKAQLLETLSHQIQDAIVTNVTEILQAVESAEP